MKYIEKFKFRLDDMNRNGNLKNESILRILESIAGYHSDSLGFGYCDISKNKIGWVLLDWKVEVLKRPSYPEELTVTTWGRKMIKCYTYRDYEVRDKKGELCVRATSKWTLIDLEKGKLARLTEEIVNRYQPEEVCAFENDEIERLKEPEQYENAIDYKVRKNEIDNNGHVHNIYYLNMAYEALPEKIFFQQELNNMRITYKRQIKFGQTVECRYTYEQGKHIVTIVQKEDSSVHAIVELW